MDNDKLIKDLAKKALEKANGNPAEALKRMDDIGKQLN